MNNTTMESLSIFENPCQERLNGLCAVFAITISFLATAIILLLMGVFFTCSAQSTPPQQVSIEPKEATLSGTLHLYLVTNFGDKMQKVDRYRETGEGSMIAFILKTDKKIDMSQYLDKEDVEALREYCGETLQSEFMLVPD